MAISLSEQDFQNIKANVERDYIEGGYGIAEWTSENDFYVARYCLERPDASQNLTHFMIKALGQLIEILFPTWDLAKIMEISEDFLRLLFENIERFSEHDFLLNAYCEMYARVVKIGWHMSPGYAEVYNCFQNFFEGNILQLRAGLRLCAEIVDKMKLFRKVKSEPLEKFKTETMCQFLVKCHQTLTWLLTDAPSVVDSNGINKAIQACLELAQNIFDFVYSAYITTENHNRDAEKMIMTIPLEWQQNIQFPVFIGQIFRSYKLVTDQNDQTLALNVILRLSSIKTSGTASHGNLLQYYQSIIDNLSSVIEEDSHLEQPDKVYQLSIIITRIKVALTSDLAAQIIQFPRFVNTVYGLTVNLFTIENFMDEVIQSAALELAKFWSRLIQLLDYSIGGEHPHEQYRGLINDVAGKYFKLLNAITVGDEIPLDVVWSIIFPEFATIPTSIIRLVELFEVNPTTFLDGLFTALRENRRAFFETLPDPDSNAPVERQMCLDALAVLCLVLETKVTPRQLEAFYMNTSELLAIVRETGDSLAEIGWGPELTEKTILLIIRNICNDNNGIMRLRNELIPELLKVNNGVSTLMDIYILFIDRIKLSLRFFPESSDVVEIAISALDKLIKYLPEWIFSETASQAFDDLEFSDAEQYAFFDLPANQHSRIEFFRILSWSMPNLDPSAYGAFVRGILSRIEDLKMEPSEDECAKLLIDLRGTFKGTDTDSRYKMFFDVFFPDAIGALCEIAEEYPNITNIYLKFQCELCKGRCARISFEQHSASGLLLFKAEAQTLVNFFSKEGNTAENDATKQAFMIMSQILNNKDLSIGALEAYGDPALDNLMGAFLHFVSVSDETVFKSVQKLTPICVTLFSLIFNNYQDYVGKAPEFAVSSLRFATALIQGRDAEVDNFINLLQLLRRITAFVDRSRGNQEFAPTLNEMMPIFKDVLEMLETNFYTMEQSTYVNVTENMKAVIALGPDNWPIVRQRLSLFVKNCTEGDVKEIIQEIIGKEDENKPEE